MTRSRGRRRWPKGREGASLRRAGGRALCEEEQPAKTLSEGAWGLQEAWRAVWLEGQEEAQDGAGGVRGRGECGAGPAGHAWAALREEELTASVALTSDFKKNT